MELNTWFPEARFVHVLRNPYANIYSLRKGRRTTPDLRNTFYRPTAKSHYFMERNQRYIENYKVVWYEDIVLRTKETMAEVADHIDIGEHPTLQEPTFLGRMWGGNSRSTQGSFEGIDETPVDTYRGQISTIDIALVNRYFSPLLSEYKYERHATPKFRIWIPSGFESPVSYLKNRSFSYSKTL